MNSSKNALHISPKLLIVSAGIRRNQLRADPLSIWGNVLHLSAFVVSLLSMVDLKLSRILCSLVSEIFAQVSCWEFRGEHLGIHQSLYLGQIPPCGRTRGYDQTLGLGRSDGLPS
ncbi:hypothetical protein M0R45_006265 [Rubus argutus]|uniref:Uncharacterized protein n=1 Tax=Rubus argutus TaxID=59490 RepID=A0AAW1YPZ0_RUBAR